MAQPQLSELVLACQKQKNPADQVVLEMGETVTLTGRPAAAEKGTIALRNDDHTLIIKEKDILETSKEGEDYLVKLKKGTDVIVRIEMVSQVTVSDDCDCKTSGGASKETSAIPLKTQTGLDDAFGGWDKWGGWWRPPYHCWYVIHWKRVCRSYRDKYGILRVYCYNYPVVEKQCDNWF